MICKGSAVLFPRTDNEGPLNESPVDWYVAWPQIADQNKVSMACSAGEDVGASQNDFIREKVSDLQFTRLDHIGHGHQDAIKI